MAIFSDLTATERSEFWALLALRHAYGIGPLRAKRLWEAFGSGLAAVEACLSNPAAWSDRTISPLATARKFASGQWREKATQEWLAAKNTNLAFVCIGDADYPELLRELPDAPLILYYRGRLSLLRGPAVGVVGARDCTLEGISVSAFFSRHLSKAGVTVISGLARGIDRAAHLAGLDGMGGSIGVLGTGADVVYPLCNADLYALMSEQGLIVSEFAPGTTANPRNFPVRNRLISGLSRGVLVIEAAGRSGSLITARLALEQNRDVFAVPGHTMAAVSEGCRELIRRGAKAVFNADDILSELAPLLSLDMRKALEKRHKAAAVCREGQARKRSEAPFDEAWAEAQPVLPEGKLPWEAPRAGKKKTAYPHLEQSDAAALPPVPEALKSEADRQLNDALNTEERLIMRALSAKPAHIDEIALETGLDVSKLSALLTMMEMRGLVRHEAGMRYRSGISQ